MKLNFKEILKNVLISIAILLVAVGVSIAFQKMDVEEHITTFFVFAVFLISLITDGYIYGVLSAIAAMFAVNYVFTFPYFAFDFITPVNLISAIIMVTVAILTGMLTTKIKLHEATKAESERERMRANLLRAVSHDLRTPLTTIYSASTTLRSKRESLTTAQQDAMLLSIQEDSEWLVRMVENLLSITRIDSGKIKITKTPTILDELVDSVMTKFLSRYPGQEVVLDIPDEIIVVPMDTILIEQVLINLLENAVVHATGMKTLTLHIFTLAHQAIFEVLDDGCGISEGRLKHIFTGCYETPGEASDGRKRNAGIGLSVCATIIKAHGGEISAENRKTGGALFRFTLDTEEITDDK